MVLAYIPVFGSPLQAKYHGPYKVQGKLSNHYYMTETPDRRKSTQYIQVNLLKLYKRTEPPNNYSRPISGNVTLATPVNNVKTSTRELRVGKPHGTSKQH